MTCLGASDDVLIFTLAEGPLKNKAHEAPRLARSPIVTPE
jgi:hypothetical protein